MAEETEIFSRERLAGYDPTCLAGSVALVVGAGALGQNVVQNLALSGFGEIRVVDHDEFEDHNRTRSPAFPSEEEQRLLGRKKAAVVGHKFYRVMTALNPRMRYSPHPIQWLGNGAFEGVSIILSCVDNPLARAYLSDQARWNNIPFVEGGFNGPALNLSCFPLGHDTEADPPCWRCGHQELVGVFSCRFYAEQADRVGIVPAIQNGAAALAALQTEAAILAVHRLAPLAFQSFHMNIRTGATQMIRLSRDPDCPGNHETRQAVARPLGVASGDPVRVLLEELHAGFQGPVGVELSHPFAWDVPCSNCGRLALVRKPAWVWASQPYCTFCGGEFSPADLVQTAQGTVYNRLFPDSRREILELSCWAVGFPPLAEVRAFSDAGETELFRMSGSIDDLFTTVCHDNP